jgi:hypothetical protein
MGGHRFRSVLSNIHGWASRQVRNLHGWASSGLPRLGYSSGRLEVWIMPGQYGMGAYHGWALLGQSQVWITYRSLIICMHRSWTGVVESD